MRYVQKLLLPLAAVACAGLFVSANASAELLCDCTRVIDTCDASVNLAGSRVNVESSNDSCARVDYLIEGQPYTALVVGGSGEFAGPSLPMRNASVVVESCRVCAENGVTNGASSSTAKSGDSKDAEPEQGQLRSIIKVMPEYPRAAWMNKLAGAVTVEFSVSETGEVQNIKVIRSSSPLFDLPVIDAVSRFKYAPAKEGDKAVVSTGIRERFIFSLADNGTRTSVTSVTETSAADSASPE